MGPHARLLLVAAIAVAGLVVRLPFLGDSLFGDELSTYSIVTGNGPEEILRTLHGNSVDLNPPLFFLAARLAQVFGSAPELLKAVPLVAGVAALPLIYVVGVRTVGPRAAVAAAAIAALNPLLIYYSTEARAYMPLAAIGLVSSSTLIRALESRQKRWWVAYAVASCAGVYTHFTIVFLLLGQFVWAFATHPGARRALLTANAAAAAGFIPWLPALVENTESPGVQLIEQLHPFTPRQISVDLAHLGAGHAYLSLREIPGDLGIAILAAALLLGALAAAVAHRKRALPDHPALGLAVMLAVSVPLGLLISGLVGEHSVWDRRNLIASAPGVMLLMGAFVTAGPPRLRVATTALVLSGLLVGLPPLYSQDNRRPDFDALAAFIQRTGAPSDPVVEDTVLAGPGPYSPMDAALRKLGRAGADHRRPAFRLNSAPLPAVLAARPYALLPPIPPRTVARRAARLARGGSVFLVVPGEAPYESVRASPLFGAGHEFLSALPARLRLATQRTFDGYLPHTVFVLREARGD